MADDTRIDFNIVSGSPPCSLREACARAGLDRGGQRCPTCPVRELCESDLRWLVRPAPIQ